MAAMRFGALSVNDDDLIPMSSGRAPRTESVNPPAKGNNERYLIRFLRFIIYRFTILIYYENLSSLQ
jgi:hypothetical protein